MRSIEPVECNQLYMIARVCNTVSLLNGVGHHETSLLVGIGF
jgi:hypothetical protein